MNEMYKFLYDKKQITPGISELARPINVPIGMTIREGNVNDQVHFEDTFKQVKERTTWIKSNDYSPELNLSMNDTGCTGSKRSSRAGSTISSSLKIYTRNRWHPSSERLKCFSMKPR